MVLYCLKPDDQSEEVPVTVGQYLLDELARDELKFEHPLYVRMLELFRENASKPGFVAEHFFGQHPDPQVSRLSTDLLADKYVLSRYHSKMSKIEEESDRLLELVPRVMFEYKNKLLLETIKEKMLEMKRANEQNDMARQEQLMQEVGNLNVIKSQLSKTLGERIILRL